MQDRVGPARWEAIELLPHPAAAIAPDGAIAAANAAFVQLLRRGAEAVAADTGYPDCLAELLQAADLPAADRQAFLMARGAALRDGRADAFGIERTGEWACRFRTAPLPDGGCLVSVEDVSEFERRDAMLAEAELLSRSGAWELDRESGRIQFSKGAWELFGPGAQEKIGTLDRWVANIHPDDVDGMLAEVEKSRRINQPFDYAYRIYRTDGRLIEINILGRPVRDGSDPPRRVRGTFQDITRMREAQRALERSEQKFRAIVENNPGIIAILGIDGRLKFVSPAGEELLAHTGPEVIDHPWTEFVHPDDIGTAMAALQRLLGQSEESKEHTELRVRHRDGHWLTMEMVGSNFLNTEGVEGIVLSAHDVTDRKETEGRLRQAQKMEAVGQLTGGIAHDFNNLLAVISGNLELIAEGLDAIAGPAAAALQRKCETALRATDRGATLTRSLLAFARKQTLRPSIVDLNELVEEMSELVRRTTPGSVELRIRPHDGLWLCVVDSGLMQSALLNLVLNARDAMPDGGILTIATENTVLDALQAAEAEVPAGEYVLLTVADTGIGMSPETVSRAFDPFFTTKGVGQGTGLGLSMVYGFAKQSEGYSRIASTLGRGTAVRIYLPRSAGAEPTAAAEPAAAVPQGREHILVVEDDADVRDLTKAALQSLGYRAAAVSSAAQALAHLQSVPEVDMLLTDIILPDGMDGVMLADRVADLRPGLPVCFMSGHGDNAFLRNGSRHEHAPLLRKPFRRAELAEAVRALLDGPQRS